VLGAIAAEIAILATHAPRPGRKKGSKNAGAEAEDAHILYLKDKYPRLSWTQRYGKADKSIIGTMAEGTFCNRGQRLSRK